jgi:hypothetical protein
LPQKKYVHADSPLVRLLAFGSLFHLLLLLTLFQYNLMHFVHPHARFGAGDPNKHYKTMFPNIPGLMPEDDPEDDPEDPEEDSPEDSPRDPSEDDSGLPFEDFAVDPFDKYSEDSSKAPAVKQPMVMKETMRVLGVIVDYKLNWKAHVSMVRPRPRLPLDPRKRFQLSPKPVLFTVLTSTFRFDPRRAAVWPTCAALEARHGARRWPP